MSKPWDELRERLLRSGVAPRHVRRYLGELTDHLADLTAEEQRAGRIPTDAQTAARARLGTIDELARAMEARDDLRAWSARAPWLVFGVAPMLAVAAAYLAGLTLLWTGWHLFVPNSMTPFVRISGVAIVWFGLGRLIYFTAPVVVSWGLAVLAARQRIGARWPAIGFLLLALVGGTAHVHVARWGGGWRGNRVSMSLNLTEFHYSLARSGHTLALQLLSPGLLHIILLFTLAAFPYLAWEWYRRALPA